MVDNVTADAGAGGVDFATDDIGGVHYPRTKLVIGADGTNDGDVASGNPLPVDVISAIPGTGATNLGKAIDTAVGATDTGVAMLAKHAAAAARLSTAESDYDLPRLSEFGALLTEPEQHLVIDEMDALTAGGGTWAAIDSDTTGVALSTKHVLGAGSIEFDKVDGAANSGIGGITKALTAIDLSGASPHDILQTVVYVADTSDLDGGSSYLFLRLGTDSTDYNEWRIDSANLTAGLWETIAFEIGDASFAGQGGDGITWTAITYIAVGFVFDAVGDALANIYVDEISFHTNQHVNAAINAEITSDISSANVNIHKVGNKVVNTQAGNIGTGTQRVTIATDDANLAAIKTAVEGALDVSGATVTVDGSGVTQPVSGTVTANLSATDNAVLDTIDAVLDTINAKLVTGTVIGDVNLGATDNAVLDDIAAQVTTVAAAVSTEMQVDVVGPLPAGTAAIGKLAANSGVDIGDVDVTSISAGANLVGDVGISGTRTSGGTTIFRSIDLDEGTLEVVKAGAGQIYWIHVMNLATAVRYVKIYNATSGTYGTGTPVLTFPIPTQGDSNGAGFTLSVPNGIAFATGISIGAGTGIADNDTGAPGVNEVVVNLGYA